MSFADDLAKAGLANYERTSAVAYRSTGYAPLDAALSGLYKGGGFADGRIVEIFGPSSAGKTVIATYVMASAQQAGGLAGFHDHERTFRKDLGQAMCGLSISPNNFVYDQPWTFEQSFDKMQAKVLLARGMEFSESDGEYKLKKGAKVYFPLDKPIVWVFDSLHSMVPMSAAGKEMTKRNMNDNLALPRATSAHFPSIAMFAEATNTLIIFLNQIRLDQANTKNPKYPVYKSPGGDAPVYYASQRLQLTRSILREKGTEGGPEIGQRVTCKVIKNKVYRPNLKVSWDFMYQADGTGAFDTIGGTLDRVVELGLIKVAGSWYTWIDGTKYGSKAKMVDHIRANGLLPALLDMLPEQLATTEVAAQEHEGPEEDAEGFAAAVEAEVDG
jgi:RecA/RadA recombinase